MAPLKMEISANTGGTPISIYLILVFPKNPN